VLVHTVFCKHYKLYKEPKADQFHCSLQSTVVYSWFSVCPTPMWLSSLTAYQCSVCNSVRQVRGTLGLSIQSSTAVVASMVHSVHAVPAQWNQLPFSSDYTNRLPSFYS